MKIKNAHRKSYGEEKKKRKKRSCGFSRERKTRRPKRTGKTFSHGSCTAIPDVFGEKRKKGKGTPSIPTFRASPKSALSAPRLMKEPISKKKEEKKKKRGAR